MVPVLDLRENRCKWHLEPLLFGFRFLNAKARLKGWTQRVSLRPILIHLPESKLSKKNNKSKFNLVLKEFPEFESSFTTIWSCVDCLVLQPIGNKCSKSFLFGAEIEVFGWWGGGGGGGGCGVKVVL